MEIPPPKMARMKISASFPHGMDAPGEKKEDDENEYSSEEGKRKGRNRIRRRRSRPVERGFRGTAMKMRTKTITRKDKEENDEEEER